MKYAVFTLDRYKLQRSSLEVHTSDKMFLKDILPEHFEQECIDYWNKNNKICLNGSELSIDEEEMGFFFKRIE